MAKSNNNFVKSKMNGDLNARLIPPGEYRNAYNIEVSTSEGSDVGTVQTALGNSEVGSFNSLEIENQNIIGVFASELLNSLFIFITDYIDTSSSGVSNFAVENSVCKIIRRDFTNGETVVLVEGYFLNFSLNKPILGINLIDDLLFFTDNRNQPRKININLANPAKVANPTFYTNEDQISVAKYYPFKPISLTNSYITDFQITASGGSGDPANPSEYGQLITNGENINLSTKFGSGTGLTVNILSTNIDGGVTDLEINNPGVGYKDGDILDVFPKASFNPQGIPCQITLTVEDQTSMKDKCSEFLPPTEAGFFDSIDSANKIKLSTTIDDSTLSLGMGVENLNKKDGVYYLEGLPSGNFIKISKSAPPNMSSVAPSPPWEEDDVIVFRHLNPDYDPNFAGDCEYLKDKFVRFSYRFKFVDGEYSLIAPFTQACFIPNQDGYFKPLDEEQAFDRTDLDFFENKVNSIDLIIECPDGDKWSDLYDKMHVDSIEIIYKDDADQNLKIVESISRNTYINNETNLLLYNYQSTSPYKTLPSSEITRVYDQVPIRAKTQEVVGNRIVYANFINKHSSIKELDFGIGYGSKSEEDQKEYQNHNIKQNRSYQVGLVLSDRYGRQSDVIVGKTLDAAEGSTGAQFVNSSIEVPYKPQGFDATLIESGNTWGGDALKLKMFSPFPEQVSVSGWPGLYSSINADQISSFYPGFGFLTDGTNVATTTSGNGVGLTVNYVINKDGNIIDIEINATGSGYVEGDVITIQSPDQAQPNSDATFVYDPNIDVNLLGWSSYKVVVKQQEQEYYNVYLPSILNNTLETIRGNATTVNSNAVMPESDSRALITLFGDNINKVPQDLNEVGPTQELFTSNVFLNLRVNNINSNNTNSNYNIQFYPFPNKQEKVVTIGSLSDLNLSGDRAYTFEVEANATAPDNTFYLIGYDENVVPGMLITGRQSDGSVISGLEQKDGVYVFAVGKASDSGTGDDRTWIQPSKPLSITSTGNNLTLSPTLGIYNSSNNPLVGVLNTTKTVGGVLADNNPTLLTVFETEPTVSNLDIYYETSTSDLISTLNNEISLDDTDSIFGVTNITFLCNESDLPGTVVTNTFYGVNSSYVNIQSSTVSGLLLDIVDGTGASRNGEFLLNDLSNGAFNVSLNSYQVYRENALKNVFSFTVQLSYNGVNVIKVFSGSLGNVAPFATVYNRSRTIGTDEPTIAYNWDSGYKYDLEEMYNGSAGVNLDDVDLQIELVSMVLAFSGTTTYNPWDGSKQLWPPTPDNDDGIEFQQWSVCTIKQKQGNSYINDPNYPMDLANADSSNLLAFGNSAYSYLKDNKVYLEITDGGPGLPGASVQGWITGVGPNVSWVYKFRLKDAANNASSLITVTLNAEGNPPGGPNGDPYGGGGANWNGSSSDRRLKKNIKYIKTSKKGYKIYSFEYINKPGVYQGVMSDEVPKEFVSVDENGFDVVDYSKIDVDFLKINVEVSENK